MRMGSHGPRAVALHGDGIVVPASRTGQVAGITTLRQSGATAPRHDDTTAPRHHGTTAFRHYGFTTPRIEEESMKDPRARPALRQGQATAATATRRPARS